MVLLIIIPIKLLFHWEYTLFSDKPIWLIATPQKNGYNIGKIYMKYPMKYYGIYPFISIYIHLYPFISIYIHLYPFISIYIHLYP